MKNFDKRNYVITGAGSGIGLEISRMLIERGAEVCLVGRRESLLDQAVAELGPRSWACPCDVARKESIQALVDAVGRKWSQLDGLVNNAGVAPMADIENTDADLWDEVFAINVRGPFLTAKFFLPLLRNSEKAAIIKVSSTLAERAIPGMVAYNASKAALNQLTRSLALELAPKIRVNAVMPAVVETPIHESRGMTPAQVRGMGRMHPLKRIGRPEDVAALVVFLLSDKASWMTGTVLPIDGGLMAS